MTTDDAFPPNRDTAADTRKLRPDDWITTLHVAPNIEAVLAATPTGDSGESHWYPDFAEVE